MNSTYRREMKKLADVMTVPVTVIGKEVLVGYDPSAFDAAVKQL